MHARPGNNPADSHGRARELLLRYGWNSMAYQILNPGIRHWFAPAGDGVVGYVDTQGYHVVLGEPICPPERLRATAAAFAADAHQQGRRVCFLGAQDRVLIYLDVQPLFSCVRLGAQPAWHPAHWSPRLCRKASYRGQLARARNKRVRVTRWSRSHATNHPALLACLHDWLRTRRLPPLHFTVETETLGRLHDRRIYVAEQQSTVAERQSAQPDHEPQVVGFLVASPVPRRHGWLIEQIIRSTNAPNGTTELLLDTAMNDLAAAGATYATLGPSPLSQHASLPHTTQLALVGLLLAWAQAHGRRFYNFVGLDSFKAKFLPEWWEPVYGLAYQHTFSLHTLYAIAGAFSGTPPPRFIGQVFLRAAAQEQSWLLERLRDNHSVLTR
jgi:phosphatidylglycerol lysyltransferase